MMLERIRKLMRPKRVGYWAGKRRLTLTQVEIDALADLAVGYPLEEADTEERAAFKSALAKIKAHRSPIEP